MSSREGVVRDLSDMCMGGAAAILATCFTNPIEVAKTRLQLQGELKGVGEGLYRNVVHAMWVVARHEGLCALQRGLVAMMGFQFCLNSCRLGVYRICERRGITKDALGRTSLAGSAACAGAGGTLGSIAGSPFYLVKTRLQSRATGAVAVGHQHEYSSTARAFREIYVREGVRGLFRGVSSQIPRGAFGSATQMVSFAYAKDWLRERRLLLDSPLWTSFMAANLGGLLMTLCVNPFDVVATRLSNQAVNADKKGKLYSGLSDCLAKIYRTEGVAGLYKGFTANYARLGPHTVLLLVIWDQMAVVEEYLRR